MRRQANRKLFDHIIQGMDSGDVRAHALRIEIDGVRDRWNKALGTLRTIKRIDATIDWHAYCSIGCTRWFSILSVINEQR